MAPIFSYHLVVGSQFLQFSSEGLNLASSDGTLVQGDSQLTLSLVVVGLEFLEREGNMSGAFLNEILNDMI